MAKTMGERAAAGTQIDLLLGTNAAGTDGAVIDLLLDWGLAFAQKAKDQNAALDKLAARVETAETKLAALEKTVISPW